ncbi:hypothetical protein SAMN05444166_5573 [Singulisphaera sp. GP187]|uniref:hypothetical protein n=1 Tax=Singulisphaera sp. GP187 TaxID=1882752 RepID=UPI00092AEB9A|nr:hypothetical protein [Singulisphaera sp. GP187]SIO58134.1 hypothetical protein SAMN05444166_5573 [Singulisphaera sp. GP187]
MIRALRVGLLLPVVAFAGFFAGGFRPSAQGQVLDDVVGEESDGQVLEVRQRFAVAESNFDQVVFGNVRTPAAALARLETLVKLKIDEVDRIARLTDAQKRKLELASRGDIKRYFDQVAEKRKAFQLVRNDQQQFAAFYQQLLPLRTALTQGQFFGAASIFAKTLRKTLDERQVLAYDNLDRQRRLLGQQARIGRILAILDNSVGLQASQRQQLLKLIVEETHPSKVSGTYDLYLVLFQLSRLPQDRIKPIFRDAQWQLVKTQLENAGRYESMLTKQGVLPIAPDAERWIVAVETDGSKPAPNPHEKHD